MSQSNPVFQTLARQLHGIMMSFQRMLDDDFVFGSAQSVPQVATIFERVGSQPLPFAGTTMPLSELLALIAYRYGFKSVKYVGHGGYAIVVGHDEDDLPAPLQDNEKFDTRRVLRFVPHHHVQDVLGKPQHLRPFDVRLDAHNEPIRYAGYPLLLSDIFLLPRHTTRLVFRDSHGQVLQAGGHPAILHCQLLPEVIPLNDHGLRTPLAIQAGELLATVLAALGVKVADAHGGNGGVLTDKAGKPLVYQHPHAPYPEQYIPVVLDYGFYTTIHLRSLATLLAQKGVTVPMLLALINRSGVDTTPYLEFEKLGKDLETRLLHIMETSGLSPHTLGRLLFQVQPPILHPHMWLERAMSVWRTTKEKSYPALQDQERLATLYPAYDEIVFPQRIEEYHFILPG